MSAARTFQVLVAAGAMAAATGVVLSGQPVRPKNPLRDAVVDRAPSVARADLLACQQLGRAQVRQGRDLNVDEFTRLLSGTWVRHLTWYGVEVETESALYFDLRGNAPTAMMVDQSNLGKGPLAGKIEELRSAPDRLAGTAKLTFLDCDYSMVDTYYKISDEMVFEGLEVRPAAAGRPLEAAFTQLSQGQFFNRRPERRTALLAERRRGVEMLMPAVGTAFFRSVTVRPTRAGRFAGATLEMQGDYRFVHYGATERDEDRTEFAGKEVAQFFMEGNAFVASRRAAGLAGGRLAGGWATNCDASFGFQNVIYERVVLEAGQ